MRRTESARKNSRSSAASKRRVTRRSRTQRYVLCASNDGYPASLELHKIYRALGDSDAAKHGLVRVIDESGEDYLYPSRYFIPVALPKAAQKVLSPTS